MNEIRKYLIDQIKKVDKNLKEWNDDAIYKDIPLDKIDEAYSIDIGDHDSDLNSSVVTDNVDVEVRVLKKNSNRKGKVSSDSCLDLGKSIRSEILENKNYLATSISSILPVKLGVNSSSINPDLFEIKLNFRFQVNQSI